MVLYQILSSFLWISNLTEIFWNYPPELDNFILLQNLLKWKMFFKYLLLRKKLRSSSIITIHLISDNLPISRIKIIPPYKPHLAPKLCLQKNVSSISLILFPFYQRNATYMLRRKLPVNLFLYILEIHGTFISPTNN